MSTTYDQAAGIRAALGSIVNIWPSVMNASRMLGADRVTGSSEPQAPVGAHILDVRAATLHDVRFYTMLVLEQVNEGTISGKVDALDLDAMCAFLDKWAQHFAEQMPDDADQARRDLEHHRDVLVGLVRGDQMRRYQLGRCPELLLVGEAGDETLVRCPGELWATMKAGDEMLPKQIQCDKGDEHSWSPYQWHSLGKRIENANEADRQAS